MTPDQAFFVLVDVQGKLAQLMYERDQLFRNLRILVQGLRWLEVPVIWAEQYPEGMGETIPELKELLTGLEPTAKRSFSVCGHAALGEQIRATGRKEAIVAGIEAHVCVYQTVADLIRLGYGVTIVSDAISSRTSENRRIGIERMLADGARGSSVEMVLFELLAQAEGDKFRKILKLVK